MSEFSGEVVRQPAQGVDTRRAINYIRTRLAENFVSTVPSGVRRDWKLDPQQVNPLTRLENIVIDLQQGNGTEATQYFSEQQRLLQTKLEEGRAKANAPEGTYPDDTTYRELNERILLCNKEVEVLDHEQFPLAHTALNEYRARLRRERNATARGSAKVWASRIGHELHEVQELLSSLQQPTEP